MKKLQIYGTGCPKCQKLTEATQFAAAALGIPFQLEKVTDIQAITAAGVMMTPALGIDGTIVLQGKVPTVDELKKLIK